MLETSIIPIEYDDKTKCFAEELSAIIKRNPMIFQIALSPYKKISLLNQDDDETFVIKSIEDFKLLLGSVLPGYIDLLKQQVYKGNIDDIETTFLKMMLLDIVSSKENSDVEPEKVSEIKENINTIYTVVAINYYGNNEELIKFIFNPTGKEKEKIFNWLNMKHRYDLINMLLEEEYQGILELEDIEKDSYLRTHLKELLEMSELDISERFNYQKKSSVELPKLTLKELDRLCIEFFIQIDPSLKWLKIYNKLKRNNNILYGEEFPDPCSKWGCIETTDNVYLYAPLEYNISDFMYFIHEFVHCVTLLHKEKNECIPTSLQEFPSIFFERCATAFLREKGYSEQAVAELESQRKNATIVNRADISPSLRYLIDYLNLGIITYESEKSKMDVIRSSIPDDLSEELKELINILMSTQDEGNIHAKIDAENAFLIEHPDCIIKEYPYIIASHLADKILEETTKNPMLIYTMLSLAETLPKETFSSATSKLGLGEVQAASGSKEYAK